MTPGLAIEHLNDIDSRIADAVAEEDWPRFHTLLGEMLNLVQDLGESAPASVSLERQPELLHNVKRGLLAIVTARRQLQQQADRVKENIVRLDRQAHQSADSGRDDLARLALQRKQNALLDLEGLDRHIAGMEQEQEKLAQAASRARAEASDQSATASIEAELAALKGETRAKPENGT